ncbi:hypothetical protein KJZ99_08230 [bacterium]|nr:hypothetical protein [bacterium]
MQRSTPNSVNVVFVGVLAVTLVLTFTNSARADERQTLYMRWAADFAQRLETVAQRAEFLVFDHSGYWAYNGGVPALCAFAESNLADANYLLTEWREIKHPRPFDGTDIALGNAAKAAIVAAEGARDYTSIVSGTNKDYDFMRNLEAEFPRSLRAFQSALDDVSTLFDAESRMIYREGLSR